MVEVQEYTDLLERLRQDLMGYFAPSTIVRDVDRLKGWKSRLELDTSFGRILQGPYWISGASISEGSIEADRFASQLTISSRFIAMGPSGRVEMRPEGIFAYPSTDLNDISAPYVQIKHDGTFRLGDPNDDTKAVRYDGSQLYLPATSISGSISISQVSDGTIGGTYKTAATYPFLSLSPIEGIEAYNAAALRFVHIKTDGTFRLGHPTNNSLAITWDGTTLSVPKASIGQLTIGDVAGGVMPSGQQYASSGGFPRWELDNTTIRWYNASGQNVFVLGGGYTYPYIRIGSTSGQRLILDDTGLSLYNSSGVLTACFNVNGSGQVGSSSGGISWSQAGIVSIQGNLIVDGTITSTKIGWGQIISEHLANGAVTDIKVASVSASKLTSGTIQSQTITIGSGGQLSWEGGQSYINNSVIHLALTSVEADKIEFERSGSNRKVSIGGADSGSAVSLHISADDLSYSDYADLHLMAGGGYASLFIETYASPTTYATCGISAGATARFGAAINHPAGFTNFAVEHPTTSIRLADTAGAASFAILNGNGQRVFAVASNGAVLFQEISSQPVSGTQVGKLTIRRTSDGSVAGYVPLYSA